MMANINNEKKLKICILASQYFGWGKYGGFGSMSRRLAESIASRGIETSVILPRRKGQLPLEKINGVNVYSFKPFNVFEAIRLLKKSKANIFHSQDPTFLSSLAQIVRRNDIHLITCRDPRDSKDWLIEFKDATWGRRLKIPLNYLLEGSFLVSYAVKRAAGVYTPAHFLIEKVKRMYNPRAEVRMLPNLIEVPKELPPKPEKPVLTFIGRLDRRKRPEIFLELARKFPDYTFVVVGKAESPERDAILKKQYANLPNIDWQGFVDRFREPERMAKILEKTWILVNTASREGLPMSFLEAAGYSCAIVSGVDPDNFSGRFGLNAINDNYEKAIADIMSDKNVAKEKGRAAREYVLTEYEWNIALDRHIQIYINQLENKTNLFNEQD